MGVSTSNHGDIKIWTLLGINSFEWLWNNLKITSLEMQYVETNSDRCDMLQRNGIWWLAESFMAESFKHLICSRIHIFHSSMSNGSPWHAKPPPHRSRKLPIVGNGKPRSQTKNTNIFSIKLLGPLCHASWLGGYTPDLEESSFPFLAIAVEELTFKIR